MARNLEELVQSCNIMDYLRNARSGARVFPVVPPEFTNWQDEQRAWRRTVVLYDLSYHMSNVFIRGPDTMKLLSRIAVNSLSTLSEARAKQLITVTPYGHIIGDGILFREPGDVVIFVGRAPTIDWIRYRAIADRFDVSIEVDPQQNGYLHNDGVSRKLYRYQIQGPNAWNLLERLNGGPIEHIPLFHVGYINILGKRVRALHHGMAGAPGLEVYGPFQDAIEVRSEIMRVGEEFGIVPVGARAYSMNALESGWIASPLPGVYTGNELKGYREWLTADSYEGASSIGGSYVPDSITGYYVTPFNLGYKHIIKYDHEFIGADALRHMDVDKQWRKVTFAWNNEDLGSVFTSLFNHEGENNKFFQVPQANYSFSNYDKVLDASGQVVGLSMYTGYSANEGCGLSVGIVDPAIEIGRELTLVWGEPDGGTRKPTVERHRQARVRVVVSPAPYSRVVRETYAGGGWRKEQER